MACSPPRRSLNGQQWTVFPFGVSFFQFSSCSPHMHAFGFLHRWDSSSHCNTHPYVFQTIMTFNTRTLVPLIQLNWARPSASRNDMNLICPSACFCVCVCVCVFVDRAESPHHYHSDAARTAHPNPPSQPHRSRSASSQRTWKPGVCHLQSEILLFHFALYQSQTKQVASQVPFAFMRSWRIKRAPHQSHFRFPLTLISPFILHPNFILSNAVYSQCPAAPKRS